MIFSSAVIVLASQLVAKASASPASSPVSKRSPLGISLPPLIPSIPGVTEPLVDAAPPLPILQLPTPPLDSLPFDTKEIKAKKIGYIWTGAGDNHHKDFLAAVSLDDDTFGEFLHIADVPTSGNSPHHLGTSLDGKTLVGGGLLSLLKTQDTAFYWDSSDPYHPKFSHSNRAVLSSITDEIRAKPEGGFLITYMGSALGTSPGRLVETDAGGNIIHEWPEDVDGTLNILGEQFSPHGLSVDFEKNLILTSDFVVPLSILKPVSALGIQKANTLRLWTLNDRKIISTITIPDGQGIQDVKFIPGNPESAAIATAVKNGQVWIIYPFRKDANGKQGVAELLYDLGPKAKESVAIYSDVSDDGKFAYFTLTLGNHVAALDISDLNNVKRLDDPNEQQPIIGPHYVKISPDKKNLLVCGYFVQAGDISVLNTPGDYKVHWIDILDNGALSFNRTIDFETIFTRTRGGARPHSAVIFDLTDPNHPVYY
ncbi:selenium-binding protein [Cordyceps javanica]|uniref:Selenium-binding protein n=1 Tax=Cordyceps javanica TaxID=43265 RepID=A0A545VL75_9HYPO|nr:selenium-binding protein [Cordyceps javanica]TQW02430.1 selenium-binding protein [Cordyceps javanica]